MRRIASAALTVLMAFSLMLSLSTSVNANAIAGGGYSSSYSGESVFTNLGPGGSGQFSAIFFNDGSTTWSPGVVGLLVCAADKTTCNVASPNAAYASGWFSSTVYASVSATVAPGQNGFFIYNFVVPAGTPAGTAATFNGDVGLIGSGLELRPQGYFQINTTPGAGGGGLTISPASASVPLGGTQQFTASGASAGATISWSVSGGCGAITNAGLFAATATNSAGQPCSVNAASSDGLSASAPVTVFGAATQIACTTSKSTVPADNSTTNVVTGTLKDQNGNTVANDNTTALSFTNNTPTIVGPSDNGFAVTATNGAASRTYTAKTTAGNAVVSVSSGTLTGCSATWSVTAPGAAAKLAASFSPGTISADGTSTSSLEVDVTDANGTIIPSNADSITISETSGSNICNVNSGAATQTLPASGGSAFFTITSTTTPGTCSWTATDASNSTVTAASATLTTVITGAPNKLVVTGNTSPKTADGVATLKVTVALQDANGVTITTPSVNAATTVTATNGTGCTGTKADGSAGTVLPAGPTAKSPTAGLAKFTYSSSFATTCTITFTATNGTLSISGTSAAITFNAGGAAKVACVFSPHTIKNDGAATSIGTASITDANNNLVAAGSFSVGFSATTTNPADGTFNTTLVTTSPQSTNNGTANFTVKSSGSDALHTGTDTYTATATIAGATQSGTCDVQTSPTL